MNNLIFLIVCIAGVRCQNNNTYSAIEFCKNPKTDTNFDPIWLDENTPPGGWHVIMGNPSARLHLSSLLRGRNLTGDENEDFSGLCATTVYSNSKTQLGGHFRGFESLSATRNCSNSSGDIICEYNSVTNPDYKEFANVYVTYFGEKSYLNFQVYVYCWTNGDVGWILSANRKSITPDESVLVAEHLKSNGFNTTEAVAMYTAQCDYIEAKSIWFPSGIWTKERLNYFAPPSTAQPGGAGGGWNNGWSSWI